MELHMSQSLGEIFAPNQPQQLHTKARQLGIPCLHLNAFCKTLGVGIILLGDEEYCAMSQIQKGGYVQILQLAELEECSSVAPPPTVFFVLASSKDLIGQGLEILMIY
ncbi:hypothetical protein BY996DRAFT_6420101 [Phakopsora pachyrhizi]|nr:hypothetical protein BY996DRAFT_6420101 [Phakopsora pachyrhizi]